MFVILYPIVSRFSIITLFFVFFLNISYGQTTNRNLGFERVQHVEVLKNSLALPHAWAGGINSLFFSQIDLNLDGIPDFIAFEKHGNRILPFVNKGTNSNPQFVYAPEYKHRFPDLHDWVILKDFNKDGKVDIFTYGLGGIRVFQNTSNQELTFKLVADPVNYENGINIYASPDDYLGIEDIDGDGKLDFINFSVLGKFVHFYKDIAKNNDYFSFILADECWGKFSETADNNEITLFSNCNEKSNSGDPKHVGSSIFVLDFNDDGLKDVVIGDVDYPGLILLINGGTKEEALMISQSGDFPNAQNPVHIYSMPAVSTMEFHGAIKPDLFVSPSDPSLTKSEDLNSVWRYQYNEQVNGYVLETKAFLQEDMIDIGSGAIPVLFDWTGNGLFDLFVSNYGSFDSAKYKEGMLQSHYSSSITYYKNTGTKTNPKFEFVTSDFGDLKKYGFLALYPTFADLNGDSKIDLLCGNSDGSLLFFENTAPNGELPNFKPPVKNYQNIKVDAFSAPQLFDMDRDGLLDLVVGNRRGTISYYQNKGTNQTPNFQLVTSNFGNVDMQDLGIAYHGYSTPHFFRYNNETLLLCGDQHGNLFLFSNIDNHLSGEFTCIGKLTETVQNKTFIIKEGIRATVAVADLNGDGKPDLIAGNWAGGVALFYGCEPPNSVEKWQVAHFNVFPNPTTGELQIANRSPDRGKLSEANYELRIKNVAVFDIYGRNVGAIFPSNSLEGWQPQADGMGSKLSAQHSQTGGVVLNISYLPAGVYFLKIESNGITLTKKVIKM